MLDRKSVSSPNVFCYFRTALVFIIISLMIGLLPNHIESNALAFQNDVSCDVIGTPEERIDDFYWSSDGRVIISQAFGFQTLDLSVWSVTSDVETAEIDPLEIPLMWSPSPARLAWSPDGTQVAYIEDDILTVRNMVTETAYEIPTTSLNGVQNTVAWSYDGRFFAIDQYQRLSHLQLQIWEATSGSLYWEIEDQELRDFTWHPSESWFMFPYDWQLDDDTLQFGLKVFDVESQAPLTEFRLPVDFLSFFNTNLIHNPLWSPDGQYIIADFDMESLLPTVIWNTETFEMTIAEFSNMESWDFYENKLAIATTNGLSLFEVWDIETQELIGTMSLFPLGAVKWSPNGDTFAVSSRSDILVCSFAME